MADPFESKEPFKFTQYLRQKLREGRQGPQGGNAQRLNHQQELREIGKRNAQIKKNFELEKKGLVINAFEYEQDANLMKHMRLSQEERYNQFYNELDAKSRKLDKPPQLAQDYVLGRVYKLTTMKIGKEEVSDKFKSDYFNFIAVFEQRLDPKIKGELQDVCLQIFSHKANILSSEQKLDFLESQGYKYSDSTFDDLYVRGFKENLVNISTDSSEEREDEKSHIQELGSKKQSKQDGGQKKIDFGADDYEKEPDQNDKFQNNQAEPQRQKQRDLFNVEDDSSNIEEEKVQYEQEEEIDFDRIEPHKINWFKYIIDKYLKLQDEEGNPSALNNADAYVNLLNILLTSKKNEEIQEELLDLVGFHNFELLEQLINRRDVIKEHCKILNEKLQQEKQQDNYRPKNMGLPVVAIGVTVERKEKKSKKGGAKKNLVENEKVSNYDLLKKLGFDKEFIEENRRLGLKESKLQQKQGGLKDYLLAYKEEKQRDQQAQTFERPELKKGYKINEEENDEYKYVQIVPPPKDPIGKKELVPITDLPQWAQKAFGSATHLNQIQSKVYPIGFQSNRNLLISAPTGAGKTNIALMTVLREVSQHISEDSWDMSLKSFKIIYIAPLKALAAEIVGKFQTALAYLKMQVRELTGDMNMSKQEIQETHIIVSTPEKWDVVTRKTDGMMDMVNVMILDEIHLLNDERGLVLECLVARALMTGMKNQKPVRLVGLSATLPNYMDVAAFINADDKGTFAFDQSYRPTPLKCGFYGIKNLGNAQRANHIMNDIIYSNLKRILKMGKQVIIFVHKRAETHSTAKELIEILQKKAGDMHLFDCDSSYTRKQDVQKSKNEQIKQLFQFGFSIHNAGLLRKDRNLVESLFMEGHIKVLVSTATLAWGVNLPAYAVIIKGTKVYDSSSGEYKDIGIFDVQQIFGRAGRPQFDHEGEAIILTLHKQMDDYVKMMANKQTIESNLTRGLDNCINAEIACGTIATLTDGVHWLRKTYFYQRLIRNPQQYGVKVSEIQNDPSGHYILLEKIAESVARLNRMQLIRFNEHTESVYSTDMGRIASNYYINVETMSYFMENLKPTLRQELFLYHLANAAEFKQLEARKEEYEELQYLINDIKFVEVDKTCFNEAYTKVQVLFEAYLRHKQLKAFSLISDMAYIVQNSARLLRAMFEIALNKNYANLAKIALRWVHILDKRLQPNDHPMKQFCIDSHVGKLTNQNQHVTRFGYMDEQIAYRLRTADLTLERIYNNELEDVTRYLGPQVEELRKFVSYLPKLEVEINCQPITRAILKVQLTIKPDFEWNDRWNGKSEPFWIIVDNEQEILHSEFFMLHKKDAKNAQRAQKTGVAFKNQTDFSLTFFVPYEVEEGERRIAAGSYYNLHIVSDRWYDIDFWHSINLEDIQVPDEDYPHSKLLNIRPLHVTALNNEKFEELYQGKFRFFNPVQTQVFHTLYHTDSNVLIGAPTGSGKTIMSELAMLRVFQKAPKTKVIYIAPLKALAKERIIDWKKRLQEGNLKKIVLELTGDFTPDLKALQQADVLITTPEKWDGISRNWQHRSYVQQVSLVIIDEIHLLGQERGPVIEVIVSRMRYISEQTGNTVRFVGLSTALANAKDVADWLGIHKLGLFNFKPSVRPVPIKVFFEGFSEKHYCPRMATMNKPAFKAIQTHSRNHPVLVFVSSRRQTRLTALDLIALSAADQQDRGEYDGSGEFKRPFLHMDSEQIHHISELIKDENLRHTIQFGVGMHHAGLTENDRKIVEDLFVKKKIQVLVTTSTLAWGVNFPARLVIIKGTEFFDPKVKRYVDFPLTDLLQMMGRAGRPQFDENGYACVFVHEEKKNFYKKFLYEPFPVESSLANMLVDHLNAEIASGTLLTKQHCIDYLTWTYFFRRLTKNPAYYNLKTTGADSINNYLRGLVTSTIQKLEQAKCVEYNAEDETVTPTTIGHLASFYYLSHETMQYLNRTLAADFNISQLISVLSHAKEFAGLPVRHNEDVLNEALTHLVPLKVNKHNLEDPHVKANLLLQAHIERCPLPITDYITDTKSVLDQSIRILQGMIDVSAHKGFLKTTLNMIHLMQMIIQGQWLDQSPLINIPHFNADLIRRLARANVYYLPQLVKRCSTDIKKFFTQELGMTTMPYSQLKDIYKCLNKVPIVEVKFAVAAVDDKNEPQEGESLQEGGDALVTISLSRLNHVNKQRVAIQHFPKVKDASWFLLIGDEKKNEILALKRVTFNRQTKKNLSIVLPQDFLNDKLQLFLMCDSYIGLDQQYELDLIYLNGLIQGKTNAQIDEEKKYYASFSDLKNLKVDDILSDDEQEQQKSTIKKVQPQKQNEEAKQSQNQPDQKQDKKKEGPTMHDQIKKSIMGILDDDDFGPLNNEDSDDDEGDNDDEDQMIEKDIDNWI